MLKPMELTTRRGRIALRLTWQRLGEDLCVTLSGGDRPHIGAMALHVPGTTPAAVLTVPRHRETELAQEVADRLGERLGVTVGVLCGIHVDSLRAEELTDVLAMSRELTERLLAQMGA